MTQFLIGLGLLAFAIVGYFINHRGEFTRNGRRDNRATQEKTQEYQSPNLMEAQR